MAATQWLLCHTQPLLLHGRRRAWPSALYPSQFFSTKQGNVGCPGSIFICSGLQGGGDPPGMNSTLSLFSTPCHLLLNGGCKHPLILGSSQISYNLGEKIVDLLTGSLSAPFKFHYERAWRKGLCREYSHHRKRVLTFFWPSSQILSESVTCFPWQWEILSSHSQKKQQELT